MLWLNTNNTCVLIEKVLVVPMLAPRSYTREDVVELQCHGGDICVRRILQLCLEAGARLAQPGQLWNTPPARRWAGSFCLPRARWKPKKVHLTWFSFSLPIELRRGGSFPQHKYLASVDPKDRAQEQPQRELHWACEIYSRQLRSDDVLWSRITFPSRFVNTPHDVP